MAAGLQAYLLIITQTLQDCKHTSMTSILQAAQHTALPARQQPVAALAAACRPTCTTPTTPALVGCGGRHLQPAHCRRCRRRLPPACAAAGSEEGLPANSSPSAVADWAAVSFKDTARTNLVKACLLIALEEEAAASAAYAEAEGVDGDALRG